MRQIGRKCRAFLFYLFTDCYFLHASSEAVWCREGDLKRYLPDARNHRLFWALLEDFKSSIGLKRADLDDDRSLDLEFLRNHLRGSTYLSPLPFCCSYMHRPALAQDWAWNIIRELFYRFEDYGVPIGSDMATLLIAVPYVYLTRHMVTVKMTECLHSLADIMEPSARKFPLNFSEYKEWGWNAESFRAAFATDLERRGVPKQTLERFLGLDAEYMLIMHGLHLLANPLLLSWSTDFEGRLVQKFNEHAHATILADVKATLLVGKSLNDNPSLRNFSSGCLELLEFIERAEPLLAYAHGRSLEVEDGAIAIDASYMVANQDFGANVSVHLRITRLLIQFGMARSLPQRLKCQSANVETTFGSMASSASLVVCSRKSGEE